MLDGTPVWDNTNWVFDNNNPFEITKSLDLEFDKLSQSSNEEIQF